MRIRLTQLDGKLPNLALAKLASFHRAQGHEVHFTRNAGRDMLEPAYDLVYGSAIFTRSMPLVERLRRDFPGAIVGGTGTSEWQTVEQHIGTEWEDIDYSPWPDFQHSIGFSMRGCRLACGFCVVPRKEGKPKDNATIAGIWRGDPYPKNIVLLDNDFFGQPRAAWEAKIAEMLSGGFRISFNQGINVRLIDAESAKAIATVPYYDDDFKVRRLYTAFDNFKDEGIFRRGVTHLLEAGVRPSHVMVYMLVGYDETETWERIFYRLNIMLKYGVMPYPMVYERVGASRDNNSIPFRELKQFQRWIARRYYEMVPFDEWRAHGGFSAVGVDAEGAGVQRRRDRRVDILAMRRAHEPSLFESEPVL